MKKFSFKFIPFILLLWVSGIYGQTHSSEISLSTNQITMDEMIRLDYASLWSAFSDTEQGIQCTVSSGGEVEVIVYDYDKTKSDGKGIELYRIKQKATTASGIYDYDRDYNTMVALMFLGDAGTYSSLGALAAKNDVKKRAQDAKIYYPGQCNNKTWTDFFLSIYLNTCLGGYAKQVQPVIVEVKITGISTFSKAKIPGIGVVKVVNNKVVLNPPGNFYDFCENNLTSPLCQLYKSIREPKVTASEDVLIAAHRGWWGYNLGTGAPENTLEAVKQAFQQNNKIVEMDLTISADNELIFMHDYVMKRLTNYTSDKFSFELSWNTMSKYKVRKRNNEVGTVPLSRFFDVLNEIKGKQMIMMVDVKEQQSNGKDPNCLANCDFQDPEKQKESWAKIVRQCIRQAESLSAKKNLIFKTYYSYDEIYRLIGNQMNYVLWTPMIVPNNFKNSQGNPDINLMVDFINGWNTDKSKRLIACFETNFFAPDDVMLKAFTKNNKSYSNLLHYIYDATGRRSGIFSEEPVNPKGTVNRWGKWKVKNPATDIRGDFYRLINLPYGKIMLITSDRLDVWKEIKQKF